MSFAYEHGLRSGICNGCKKRQLQHELGKKFLMLNGTIYELGADPASGQSEPKSHRGHPIRFIMWGASYNHSDECYNWRPPKAKS